MKPTKTYLLEMYVKKCRINITESGNVGLLLRAGKSQSQITDAKPIIKGLINFNTNIKLNIDENALDTQRCTLTLNFTSSENAKRVVGIVVINLPGINQEVEKSFKITSTPDKQAQIELFVSVNELNDNMKVINKQTTVDKTKQLQEGKRQQSVSKLNKFANEDSRIRQSLRVDDKPASPPSSVTQKLNLKSKMSAIVQSNMSYEQLLVLVQRLQREKELLKQLLRIQMMKCFKAQTHLKNIVQILQISIGINTGTLSNETPLRSSLPGESSIIKKPQNLEIHKLTYSQSGLGMINNSGSFLNTVKESRFEDGIPQLDLRVKSNLSFTSEKSVGLLGILASMKKNMQAKGIEKKDIKRLFDKIKTQPELEIDPNKVRLLKTKIDRTYLSLMGKQSVTKDQILKHKIDLNKIIDEVLNTVVIK